MRTLFALLATAAVLAVPSAAHAQLDTSKTYRITTGSSLALDVEGGSTGDGARIIQWPLNGGRNQQWRVEGSDRFYRFVNVNSGKCLTAASRVGYAGEQLVQWNCRSGSGQWWVTAFLAGNRVATVGIAGTNLHWDIPGGSIAWGKQLQLWPGNLQAHQSFSFTPLN